MTNKLSDETARCCPQCNDGDGNCAYPYYGLAPHNFGAADYIPREHWPSNFVENEEQKYKFQGVYTHCLYCGRGEKAKAELEGNHG